MNMLCWIIRGAN